MTKPLSVRAQSIGTSTFAIDSGSKHRIVLSSVEEDQGPSPMEALLGALAGCAGIGILSILRKMRQNVTHYEIRVHGERAEQHPKVFTHIIVEHIFTGTDLRPESIQRAIELDTTNYCGVNIMLGKSATIKHTFQILEASEPEAPLPGL